MQKTKLLLRAWRVQDLTIWPPFLTAGPSPIVAQCRADLSAWPCAPKTDVFATALASVFQATCTPRHAVPAVLQDLILPVFSSPERFQASPLFGGRPLNRTILAFFRGRLQQNNPAYSRGTRQFLAKAAGGLWLFAAAVGWNTAPVYGGWREAWKTRCCETLF